MNIVDDITEYCPHSDSFRVEDRGSTFGFSLVYPADVILALCEEVRALKEKLDGGKEV